MGCVGTTPHKSQEELSGGGAWEAGGGCVLAWAAGVERGGGGRPCPATVPCGVAPTAQTGWTRWRGCWTAPRVRTPPQPRPWWMCRVCTLWGGVGWGGGGGVGVGMSAASMAPTSGAAVRKGLQGGEQPTGEPVASPSACTACTCTRVQRVAGWIARGACVRGGFGLDFVLKNAVGARRLNFRKHTHKHTPPGTELHSHRQCARCAKAVHCDFVLTVTQILALGVLGCPTLGALQSVAPSVQY